MSVDNYETRPERAAGTGRSFLVTLVAILVALAALSVLVGGIYLVTASGGESPEGQTTDLTLVEQAQSKPVLTILATVIAAGVLAWLAYGLWRLKNWARTGVMLILYLGVLWGWVQVMFKVLGEIFAGEQVVPFGQILRISGFGLLEALGIALLPGLIIWVLICYQWHFEEATAARNRVDRVVRYVLLSSALLSIIIVLLIILFIGLQAGEAIQKVGILDMVFGMVWRPGSIVSDSEKSQFGMFPMIVGTILSTFGAALLGVPLSIGTAVLLAEVAPQWVREIFRPAIELLAGIPSVVFGLFGMVVLAPAIRFLWPDIPYNTGFGLLNASIILAVMIIPTITNIAEDAIRSVPRAYKEGSLALGSTHWQAIRQVIVPGARSGIVAAIILGIGRALGETMALIMVIGNSIAMPNPLNDNPLTIFLSSARTLTGNIAVEINYAAGVHRSALFFSGILLLIMILIVNSIARAIMKGGQAT